MLDHDHREPAPTILVVDDESMIVNLIAAMLGEARFTVITALGSPEALKMCAEHDSPIDLLLTDLVLSPPAFQLASEKERFPYVHGHELAKRATTLRKGLRVAFMSGNPDVVLTQQGIKRGTLPFLSKPFSVDQLVAFVQSALAGPIPVFTETTTPTNEVTWFG